MKKTITMVIIILAMVSFTSVSFGANYIHGVKTAVLPLYNSLPVGVAFEGAFGKGKWAQFKDTRGRTIVQLKGKVTPQLHEDFLKKILKLDTLAAQMELFNLEYDVLSKKERDAILKAGYAPESMAYVTEANKRMSDKMFCVVNTPVTVQWVISADGQRFELLSVVTSAWKNLELYTILELIYNS